MDYVFDSARVLGGVAAALAVAAAVRDRYQRTLGRRRDRYARLARLGVGTQLSFFESVLGEPPALKRTVVKAAYRIVYPDAEKEDISEEDDLAEVLEPATYTESIFVDRDYYVQAVSNIDDEAVLAFSVTTRRKRFRPRFTVPGGSGIRKRVRARVMREERATPLFDVRLGRTKFCELDPEDPEDFAGPHFRITLGARAARYSEFAYYGNPGHYLDFVFTADIGAPGTAPWDLLADAQEQAGYYEWPYPDRPDPDAPSPPPSPSKEPDWHDIPAAERFREEAAITTITLIHPDLWTANFPVTFGPHGDEVRLIP